jgi:hypothetical protein
MAREQVLNFATSALVGSITSGATSLTVTSGQGVLFPTGNFPLTIDSEIMLITSRSGDTFAIGQRGYDGTTAASHANAAVVQASVCAQHINHLWQNIPDTYAPMVPPASQMAGLTPSTWDNEFESLGSWTLYPTSPAGGSTWNVASSLRSHLIMDRATSDNTLYTAYVPFNPTSGHSYLLTMKLAMATNLEQAANSNNQLQCFLFVSGQTNPSASLGSNCFTIKLQPYTNTGYAYMYSAQVLGVYNSSGAGLTTLSPIVTPAIGQPLFLRIGFDGANTYTAYIGDGLCYWTLSGKSGLGFTPQSIGIQFANYLAGGSSFVGLFAVDYLRVLMDSGNPRIGN